MGPADVGAVLAPLGIAIRFFDASTATSQMAAANIGCALGQIVKSMCLVVSDKPVLVLASGDQRIDDRKLAVMFEVSRRKVRPATAEECVAIFGYEPGGVPPVGHRTRDLPIYIDQTLQRFDLLYAAGGARNAVFPITLAELQQLTSGTFADVARP